MISRLLCQDFRALRDVAIAMSPFQVLVGPNASGKSSLLDAVSFLSELLRVDLPKAILGDARAGVLPRAADPLHLGWMQQAPRFKIAVELTLPAAQAAAVPGHDRARYEVTIQLAAADCIIEQESLVLLRAGDSAPLAATLRAGGERERVVLRKRGQRDVYRAETSEWTGPFRLPPRRSALANLPEDAELFPVATWVRRTLLEGVTRVVPDVEALRRPGPPGAGERLLPDGSNTPWMIDRFRREQPDGFARWLDHVRTALPDITDVSTVERPEDRHRYLRVHYASGLVAPSWTVSDGSLRLLMLTLLGYFAAPEGIYLIEEPENGIHPRAVETVYQALSSVYDAQVLCASHSPVAVSLLRPEQLLCFQKDPDGAVRVVPGAEHAALRDYQGELDLGTLFAAGVLE